MGWLVARRGWRGDLPVASDGLERAVVAAQRDVEPDDVLAGLDEVEVLLVNASHVGRLAVEELDLLEETRLVVLVELGSELLRSGEVTKGYSSREESTVSREGDGQGGRVPLLTRALELVLDEGEALHGGGVSVFM